MHCYLPPGIDKAVVDIANPTRGSIFHIFGIFNHLLHTHCLTLNNYYHHILNHYLPELCIVTMIRPKSVLRLSHWSYRVIYHSFQHNTAKEIPVNPNICRPITLPRFCHLYDEFIWPRNSLSTNYKFQTVQWYCNYM